MDMEALIKKEIDESIEDLRTFPLINRRDFKWEYKVLETIYEEEEGFSSLDFVYILVLIMGKDKNVFVIERGTIFVDSIESPTNISGFINKEDDSSSSLNIKSIVEFIESYPCNSPTLLFSLKELLYSEDIYDSITSLTYFEEMDEYEYLELGYTVLSIPKDKELIRLYESH